MNMTYMRRITVWLTSVIISGAAVCGANIVTGGVKYSTMGSDKAKCRAANPDDMNLTEIEIRPQIIIDGQPYTVTNIEKEGFKGCRYIKSLTVPNTVNRIGMDAFIGCSALERVVLPDMANVEIPVATYGYGGNGPFLGCTSLDSVRGNTLDYPAYVLYTAFRKCDDVPFAARIPSLNVSEMASMNITNVYNTMANPADASATPKEDPVSPLDTDIPRTATDNVRTFAVVIGNEEYQRGISQVQFATKDARIFAEYCHHTLGIPESNIRAYYNATYGDMLAAVKDISSIADAYHGDINIIFYYAGHGIPDEKKRDAYLLPVDADGTMTEVCYPLAQLYDRLGSLGAKSVTVFLDACFSGATRSDDMLIAARAVRMRAATTRPVGRMVVFSASSGDQTAFPYKEKGHGIFTYYLLEKMRQSRGEVSLGELADYVSSNVAQQSVVVNRKVQIPTVSASPEIFDEWQQFKLK